MAPGTQTFIPFDTGFGSGGTIADYAPQFDYRSEIVRLGDGKLLMVGYVRASEGLRLALARFTADGKPDLGFGAGGRSDIGGPPTTASVPNVRLAVQADGKILVGTAVKVGEEQQWMLIRTGPTGQVDTSFSGDGRLLVSFPGDPRFLFLTDILVRPDQTILVAGFRDDSRLCLARFRPDGSRDRTFGDEGKLQITVPGAKARVASAVLDGSGRLLVAGASGLPDSLFDVLVARFSPAGVPDESFGFEGTSLLDFGTGSDFGQVLRLGQDGRILVGGVTDSADGRRPMLVRLLPDGDPDPGFGEGGKVRIATGKPAGNHSVTGLDLLADGRIAVAGTFKAEDRGHPDHDVPKTFVAVRRPDGTVDRSFEPAQGLVFVGSSSFVSPSRVLVDGTTLLLTANRSLSRLNPSTAFAALRLVLGATPNPASPGPLTFVVTVANDGDAPAGGIVRLRCSKPVTLLSSTSGSFTVDPNRVDVIGKVPAIPAGGSVEARLQTSVNGFEEGVELSGSIAAGSPEVNTADNSAAILVTVSRFATI